MLQQSPEVIGLLVNNIKQNDRLQDSASDAMPLIVSDDNFLYGVSGRHQQALLQKIKDRPKTQDVFELIKTYLKELHNEIIPVPIIDPDTLH